MISMWLSGRETGCAVTRVVEPLHRTRSPAPDGAAGAAEFLGAGAVAGAEVGAVEGAAVVAGPPVASAAEP
ncbi:hypothetical protein ACFY7Y_01335 [Streptomyces virginiae]|uniref:hypothetical protein n=1 Tax=Streptomyces virginiae TaxID=1961 RepID=UPI00368B4FAB